MIIYFVIYVFSNMNEMLLCHGGNIFIFKKKKTTLCFSYNSTAVEYGCADVEK